MNINSIKSGDTMDLLSPLRSPIKQPQNKPDLLNTGLNNQSKTELANQLKSEPGNQLKTEQNSQLKNETKLQAKQQEDEKEKSSITDARKMVNELNDYMDELQTSLGFSVTQEPNNQIIFQIKDRTTNEVIKQIPSEAIQKIKEKMDELTGLLLDQHA